MRGFLCLHVVVFLGKWNGGCVLQLLGHLCLVCFVDDDFCRSQGWCFDKVEVRISDQFPSEPEKRLFKVVVAFGGDVVVLEILLAVEGDHFGLDFAFLDIDLVSTEHDRDIFTDANEIAVPVGHVFVRYTRGHIKHDDGSLALNATNQK